MRGFSVFALMALGGCAAQPGPPSRLGSPGYIVIGGDTTEHPRPFVLGDTLWEGPVPAAPAAIQATLRRAARSINYPVACMRVFAARRHYVAIYAPACPGRPKCASILACPMPQAGIYDSLGRIMTDSAFARWAWELPASVVCPIARGPDGSVAPGLPLDGCGRSPPVGDLRNTPDGLPMPLGVLFPDPIKRGLFSRCSRPAPQEADGEWIPDSAVIARLEDSLPAYLALHARTPAIPDSAGPAAAYLRQYGGFLRGGRREIYVNLYRRGERMPPERYWRRVPLDVCDGGWSYIGVVYDVQTGQFSELHNNGYA